MATHPRKADLNNPRANRHVLEDAEREDHRGERARALLEADTQAALRWLTDQPLRHTSSAEWRAWLRSQPWTPGYQAAIASRVSDLLRGRSGETAEEARARILALIDELIPACRVYATGTAPQTEGGGTTILRDPETGELLRKIEHDAVCRYLKLTADLYQLVKPQEVKIEVSIGDRLAKARRRVEVASGTDQG